MKPSKPAQLFDSLEEAKHAARVQAKALGDIFFVFRSLSGNSFAVASAVDAGEHLEGFEGIMAFQNENEMVLRSGIVPPKKSGE
jgi:hypothetical protein